MGIYKLQSIFSILRFSSSSMQRSELYFQTGLLRREIFRGQSFYFSLLINTREIERDYSMKSCDNCKLQKNGMCNAGTEICDFYEPAPQSIDDYLPKKEPKNKKPHKINEIIEYGKCPRCGGLLVLKEGRYGEFIGCDNYPNCRYTSDIPNKQSDEKTNPDKPTTKDKLTKHKQNMTENEWTKMICDKLAKDLKFLDLQVDVLQRIPYANMITSYTMEEGKWEPNELVSSLFETDLVVYENISGIIKPRVVVEAKIKSATTHDAITYSYKAQKHKEITPYLRYGIMLGAQGNYSLPVRLFRHGANFDFMFSFEGEEPTAEEWMYFLGMIKREVDYSRKMESILNESGKKDRKHYFMIQKQLFME